MPVVARRPQTEGVHGENVANGNGDHELDDFDAALLQIFIAKRVINLDTALNVLTTLADATG